VGRGQRGKGWTGMFNGNGRWHWMTVLALGNLVLWVAIAVAVGLLVSDQVDVGFETKVRQAQATAIAAWNRLSDGSLTLPGRSTSLARGPGATATPAGAPPARPTPGITWSEPGPSPTRSPVAESPAAGSRPTTQSAEALPASPTPMGPRPANTPSAAGSPLGEGSAGPASHPTPEPTPTLLSRPLLLADPEIHSLADFNAEMDRSAPGRVVQIRYQEAMLNQEITTLCENNPDLPFRNVQADLKREQVVLSGELTILGFQVEARVTGAVVARDCRPQIEIQSIAVAGVLTPQLIRDQIGQEVLKAMAWYPADYPLCLEQIVLEETKATIYGYRR
jgi:hypothetical protein